MLELSIGSAHRPLRILCLGAHCDDIEIGCGGTILKLLAAHPDASVSWVVFCSTETRAREARECAAHFLQGASQSSVAVHSFRDGFLPYNGAGVKDEFEKLKKEVDPDLIFTQNLHDRHQDHRLVSDLTWNTWRNHLILEYEIPKYDGDLGTPNVFVALDKSHCEAKAGAVIKYYESQKSKHWFDPELFLSLARIRGMECASGYAEAFYSRKALLNL